MVIPKNVSSVDSYIAAFPAEQKKLLKQIRSIIKTTAPAAEEVISYQMPAYKYLGMLVYFAAHTKHIGFYPVSSAIAAFAKELVNYKTSKGTLQFPYNKPLPLGLIKKMVKFRLKENAERFAAKNKKPVKPSVKKVAVAKPTDEEKVTAYIKKLTHPLKAETQVLRAIIKSNKKLAERIKWNAPSYYYKEDLLTFNFNKKDKLLLVFHHPAIVTIKSAMLEGDYKDWRLVYFENMKAVRDKKSELEKIIKKLVKQIDTKY